MAKESDAGTYVVTDDKAWEAVGFGDTFTSAPHVVVCGAMGNTPKASIKDVTTAGFSIYSDKTGAHCWLAREGGFDSAGKDSHAGTFAIQVADTWESVPFNDTFASIPKVVVTLASVGQAGKLGCVKLVSTTGFQVMGDIAGDCCWIAREGGFE